MLAIHFCVLLSALLPCLLGGCRPTQTAGCSKCGRRSPACPSSSHLRYRYLCLAAIAHSFVHSFVRELWGHSHLFRSFVIALRVISCRCVRLCLQLLIHSSVHSSIHLFVISVRLFHVVVCVRVCVCTAHFFVRSFFRPLSSASFSFSFSFTFRFVWLCGCCCLQMCENNGRAWLGGYDTAAIGPAGFVVSEQCRFRCFLPCCCVSYLFA